MRGWRVVGLFAVVALGLGVFVALRWRVTSDITHFLPAGRDHEQAQLSRQLADSGLTRTLILSVEGSDETSVAAAAAELAGALASHPEVAWLQRGPTQEQAESVFRLYAPRASSFISEEPERDLPPALTDDGLARQARALKLALSSPLAPLLSRLAPRDPLQWFPALLKRMEAAQANALDVVNGQFLTHDHLHAILFVGSRHSPFDGEATRRLLDGIDQAFAKAQAATAAAHAESKVVLRLEKAGVAPIALDAENRMRRDLTRISVASTVGVLLLFFVFFGGLRSVLLALLPLLGGALAAAATGLLLFGQLHTLTLAIGSSLIGVALDYPILFLTHRALSPGESARDVARRTWMGILMGGVTTAAGFAALGWSSFPGVRELALTSSAGILAALAVTRGVLPALTQRMRRPRGLDRAARTATAFLSWLGRHPRLPWVTLIFAGVIVAAGVPRVHWEDSLAALNAADPALKAQTDRVRQRVSQVEEGRLVIVRARQEEDALQLNDRLATRLAQETSAGRLDGVLSLHAFLWSRALQARNRLIVGRSPALATRAIAALRAVGFCPETFGPFEQRLATLARQVAPVAQLTGAESTARSGAASSATASAGTASDEAPGAELPAFLTLAELRASPLEPMVRPFVLPLGEDVGILTFLRGVHDPAALRRAVAEVPGATFFDQRAFLDETYARFRVQTLQAVGLGLGVIALILFARYRGARATLAALLPAVLAAATTLGVFGLIGLPAHLLHVLSLLLVLSMGVDYGVFLVESARQETDQETEALTTQAATAAATTAEPSTTLDPSTTGSSTGSSSSGATLVSVLAACVTTVLSFGLLAVSSTPALRAIGLTVGIGIIFSLMLAPLARKATRL